MSNAERYLPGVSRWGDYAGRHRHQRRAAAIGRRATPVVGGVGRRWSAAAGLLASGLVVVLAIIGLGRPLGLVRHRGPAQPELARSALGPGTVSSSASSTRETDPLPAPPPSIGPLVGSGPSTSAVGALLAGLEDIRARAFAARAPALLDQVYPPGPLRAADTALLIAVVPPGCALLGVRTTYRSVRVGRTSVHSVDIAAVATLSASELACPGARPASVPGSGSHPVTMTLTWLGGRCLISARRDG